MRLQYKERTLSEEFAKLEKEAQESFRKEKTKLNSEEELFKEGIRGELIKEIRQSTSELPKRFKYILKHSEWDAITKMLNAKNNTIEGHERLLTRELGKQNKTLDWFLETFENEIIA